MFLKEVPMATIDLHMHSAYSCDGELSPRELLEIALGSGLHIVSLTDHNTCVGISEAAEAGKTMGITVIPGVELDCFYRGVLFHVLGYGIDQDNPLLREIDLDVQSRNRASSLETIRLLNRIGIKLDKEEALSKAKNGFVTGELVAEIMLNKTDAGENPLLRPYLPGGDRSDNPYVNFYWDYCGQGSPAYVHIEYISMEKALAAIGDASGVSVLAHPGQNLKGKEDMLPSIIALGIDGIEVYSSYHSPETCLYYKQQAEAYGLLASGGSDFHGKTKPSIHMGDFGLDGDGHEMAELLLSAIDAKNKGQG
jgi:predicted metal-dependent phosphoesterase TrpH